MILWPVLVIHVAEAAYMDLGRLRRHSVARGGWLWWRWMVGAFAEGFGGFLRLDDWVRTEEERKEKQRH